MEETAQRAMAAFAAGDTEAAQRLLGSLASPEVQFAVQRTHELGNACFRAGNYKEALKHYTECINAYRHLTPKTNKKSQTKQEQQVRDKLQQLHSNCSACYIALQQLDKALEAARECIKLNLSWPKGWYRAGRSLYEQQDFAGAFATFQMAQRKQQQQQAEDLSLASWIARSRDALDQQKRRMRVSLDYRRFNAVKGEYDDEAVEAAALDAVGGVEGGVLEFAADTPEEQRRQIESLLTGGATLVDSTSSSKSVKDLLRFDPSEWALETAEDFADAYTRLAAAGAARGSPEQQKLLGAQAGLTLCNYIQMGTDLREAQRCRQALNCLLSRAFLSGVQRAVKETLCLLSSSSSRDSGDSGDSKGKEEEQRYCLFVGLGDCMPLLAAAELNAKEQASSKLTRPPLNLTACTLYTSRSLIGTYATVLNACGAAEAARILPIPLYLLQLHQQQEQEQQQQKQEELPEGKRETVGETEEVAAAAAEAVAQPQQKNQMQSEKKRPLLLQQPFDCLFLDSLLFEAGILGRQLLPLVRHARSLCNQTPLVFPSRLRVWIQAYEVRLPALLPLSGDAKVTDASSTKTAETHAATPGSFDLSPFEAAARWTPHVASVALQLSPSEQQETAAAAAAVEDASTAAKVQFYGDVCTPRSKPKAVLTFRFDGPLANLDEDVPLEATKEVILESNSRPGLINACAIWADFYEFRGGLAADGGDAKETLFFSTAPDAQHDKTNGPVATAAAGADGRHCGVRLPKQGIKWLHPIWLGEGESLRVEVSHTSTKLALKVLQVLSASGAPRAATPLSPSAASEQRGAVPPHQLDVARDSVLMRLVQRSLQQQVSEKLKSFKLSAYRKQRLLRAGGGTPESSTAEGPQQQLAEIVRRATPVSLLCSGGGVLLPLLWLQAATHALYGDADMRDIRECGAPMPLRLLTVEPLSGAYAATQKLLSLNAELALKPPQKQQEPIAGAAGVWRPVKELAGKTAIEAAQQQQQQQKQQQNSSGSKANEDLLLYKAKLKETATTLQTNLFALLPAEDGEDTNALLAVAELHRMQPGADIKKEVQQLLQQQHQQNTPGSLHRLQHQACLFASLALDDAGIGEGLLAYGHYAARALLARSGAKMLPSNLRVFGALVELGVPACGGDTPSSAAAAARVWQGAAAAAMASPGDYFEVSFDEEEFVLLSRQIELWKAECKVDELAARHREIPLRGETNLSLECLRSGRANAMALWFEFSLGGQKVSTQPLAMRRQQQQLQGAYEETPGVYYTKAWKNATIVLPPVPVDVGGVVHLRVQTGVSSLRVFLASDAPSQETDDENLEEQMQGLWKPLRETHEKASDTWMRLLHPLTNFNAKKDAETPTPAQIVAAAAALARWPGEQRRFFLDPFTAAEVLRGIAY